MLWGLSIVTDKIRLELEDKTKAGLASYESSVRRADATSEDFEETIEQLQNRLSGDPYRAAKLSAKKLSDELDNAKRSSKTLEAATKSSQQQSQSFFSGLVKFELLKKGFEIARRGIESLMEKGDAGALRLKESLGKVEEGFSKLAQSPAVRGFFDFLAEKANAFASALPTAMDRAVSFWKEMQITAAGALQKVGLISAEATELLKEQVKQEKIAYDAAKKRAELEDQRLKQLKQEESIWKSVASAKEADQKEEYARSLKMIQDGGELVNIYNNLIRQQEILASNLELTEEKQKAFSEKIIAVMQRVRELGDEIQKDEEDARIKKRDKEKELADKMKELKKDEVEYYKKLEDEKYQKYLDIQKAILDKQKEFRDKILAAATGGGEGEGKAEAKGKFGVQRNLAQEFRSRISTKDIMASVRKKGIKESDEAINMKLQKDLTEMGERLQNFNQDLQQAINRGDITGAEADVTGRKFVAHYQEQRDKVKKEAEKRKGTARAEVKRDVRLRGQKGEGVEGGLTAEEVAGAVTEITKASLDKATTEGRVSALQSDVLREGVKKIVENTQELERVGIEVQALKDLLDGVTGHQKARRIRAGTRR